MTTTLLAPVDRTPATKAGPKMFRKQLLRKGTINYPVPGKPGATRSVTFDDAYMQKVAEAYQGGIYDNVPFVLADATNTHTMAPERFRGWLKGVEVTEDGIDGLLELSADAAALVEQTGGKLGVSCRLRPVQHVDGRQAEVAINHVLGTLDPRLQGPELGLRDWETVDLSTPGDDVLDLSSYDYQEGHQTMPRIDLSTLSDDDYDTLASYAAANGIDLSAEDDGDEPDDEFHAPEFQSADDEGDDEGDITDEELNALIDAELAGVSVDTGADLSTPDDDTDLDLSAAAYGVTGEEQQVTAGAPDEASALRFQLAATQLRSAGVPPFLIDLAAPVLALPDNDDTLDLASPLEDGVQVNVKHIVRRLLEEHKGTIDLAREDGSGIDSDAGQDKSKPTPTQQAWVDHVTNNA